MNQELLTQLNDLYRHLHWNGISVFQALNHRIFSLIFEYRIRHSCFDENGDRVSDDYPLPVVEVEGYCEFQIEPDCISCFTKIGKDLCAVLDRQEFEPFPFDVWGESDYYTLLYRSGSTEKKVSDVLFGADEKAFVVHFRLPKDIDEDTIYTFAKLLRKRGMHI